MAHSARALTAAKKLILLSQLPQINFGADGGTRPMGGGAIYPGQLYVASTTTTWFSYEAYRNFMRCVAICTYNHTTKQWSPEYIIGALSNVADDHGVPSLTRSSAGNIFCFYDGHSTQAPFARFRSTVNADDPTAWQSGLSLTDPTTYPHPSPIGSALQVFYRTGAADQESKLEVFNSTSLSGGIAAFPSTATTIVDWTSNNTFYQSYEIESGTDIIKSCVVGLGNDTQRQNQYIFIYSTLDGSVRNLDGSVTVPAASLPISLATSNTSFRILAQTGTQDTNLAGMCKTPNGLIHFCWVEGTTAGPTWNINYYNWNGSVLTGPVTVTTTDDNHGFQALCPHADNSVDMFLASDPGGRFARGGDMVKFTRSAAGTWGAGTTILAAGSTWSLDEPCAIKDAHPDARVAFTEVDPNGNTDPVSGTGSLKIYAYGDSGFLKRPRAPQIVLTPEFQTNIALKAALNGNPGMLVDFTQGGAGQSIARILSEAPGTLAAVQGNASAQPVLTAGSPGYAAGNGTNKSFVTTIVPAPALTMIFCGRVGATGNQLIGNAGASGNNRGFMGGISGVWGAGWGNDTAATITTGVNVANQDVLGMLWSDGVTVELWLNGTRYYAGAVNGTPASIFIGLLGRNSNGVLDDFVNGRCYRFFAMAAPLATGLKDSFQRVVGQGIVTW